MTIKHFDTVEKYAKQVFEIRAALANLEEFIDTLPAPDEDDTIPRLNYGHTGNINEIHSHITAAMEWADQFSGN